MIKLIQKKPAASSRRDGKKKNMNNTNFEKHRTRPRRRDEDVLDMTIDHKTKQLK